ncbi:uncharacterized protein GGS25DRAFT_494263 [Hypoxylon fragiforme]|uniref:uncharacterized protein n=1 Tax=Hypoxylon fragiforme TaxID=63214 RepID=UPI0020C72629|nr:uncharacterized protein GGS25DRAFT_494263 [Hypoxylon fragiforme]KAI2607077.1 hypothetical protein GGS25DRAFT_494263 [Hypoxylon fragiforme]
MNRDSPSLRLSHGVGTANLSRRFAPTRSRAPCAQEHHIRILLTVADKYPESCNIVTLQPREHAIVLSCPRFSKRTGCVELIHELNFRVTNMQQEHQCEFGHYDFVRKSRSLDFTKVILLFFRILCLVLYCTACQYWHRTARVTHRLSSVYLGNWSFSFS